MYSIRNLSDHRGLSRHHPEISPGPTWPQQEEEEDGDDDDEDFDNDDDEEEEGLEDDYDWMIE